VRKNKQFGARPTVLQAYRRERMLGRVKTEHIYYPAHVFQKTLRPQGKRRNQAVLDEKKQIDANHSAESHCFTEAQRVSLHKWHLKKRATGDSINPLLFRANVPA